MSQAPKPEATPSTSGLSRKASNIVPLALFFVVGAIIDTAPLTDEATINATAYFISVAARVMAISVALIWFTRPILEQFPMQADVRGLAVGIIGAVVWIGLCHLDLERRLIAAIGLPSDWLPGREAVDPFDTYVTSRELFAFLFFRFALLVLCVPIAEELFLRGFLMRSVESENWDRLPLSQIGRLGLVIGTAYGVLTHPGEAVAAAAWFSLVTLLMVRTGKFWNCVVAHAVTNLILGVYVCVTGNWQLW